MKTVLITGASKGIGKALAFEFARRGYSLVLVARTLPLLEETAEQIKKQFAVQVHCFAADLADPAAPQQIFDFCTRQQTALSGLVNNAGFGIWDAVEDQPLATWQEMNTVNIEAPMKLCHLFIPMLRQQQPSFILNVSSMASYQPTPWMTVYGATKSWLTSFSRGLRYELQGTGVSVSCLCPGGVVTEFAARAGNQSIVERTKLFQMPAEKAARITVRKTLNGRAEFVPGWYNQLGTLLVKFLPKGLAVSSTGRIFRKKRIHQELKG